MSKQTNFINSVKDGAIASMKKHGVLASISIAQAILESGWGGSVLATESKNLFGVKAIGGWNGAKKLYSTYEWIGGRKVKINDYFRVYGNYADSIEDHALFLVENSRYRSSGFFSTNDYKTQAQALQRAGYATDPNYAISLINLIEQYGLNKYDTASVDTSKKYTVNYCLEWQQFYNKVTQTKAPIGEDGAYGPDTQKSIDNLSNYIKQGKKYKYCLEFQKFYNNVTKTKAPLIEDGVYGPATEKAYSIISSIIKEF